MGSTEAKVEKIFKFVALRPVEEINTTASEENYIYDETDKNIFGDDLIKNVDELNNLAQQYVNSENFEIGFGDETKLVKVQEYLEKQKYKANAENLITKIESILGQDLASFMQTKGKVLKAKKASLWNSLRALVILVNYKPQFRQKIIATLRTINSLEQLAKDPKVTEDSKKLNRLLTTRPILENNTLKIKQKQKQNSKKKKQEKEKQNNKLKKQDSKLLKQILDLKVSRESLKRSYKDHLLELSKKDPHASTGAQDDTKPSKKGRSKKSSKKQDQEQINEIIETSRVRCKDLKTLGSDSRKILKDNELYGDEIFYEDTVSKLDTRIKGLSTVLFDGKNAKTINQYQKVLAKVQTIAASMPQLDLDVVYEDWINNNNYGAGNESSFANSSSAAGSIQPLGIGDLLILEQKLIRYEASEISHVENVLKSEYKERVHRTLDKTEETIFTSTSTTEETEKDLQSTDRYELQTEVEKTLEADLSLSAGLEMSASYGPVKLGVTADFATSLSSSKSSSTATSYAQEIVEQSVSKIESTIKEERTTKILSEVEETNTHGFDNKEGDGHVIGIYQWLDKVYTAQIYNYGKRLMFEFVVPEPAAFYRYTQESKSADGVSVEKPEELAEDFNHLSISPDDYETWVSKYNVQGVNPPPPETTVLATSMNQISTGEVNHYTQANKELTVPDGYRASTARVNYNITHNAGDSWFQVIVGIRQIGLGDSGFIANMNNEDSVVPIGVNAKLFCYALNVEVTCTRTAEKLEEWQLETYNAIVAAYESAKANYDAAVDAASFSSTTISATREDTNRKIEKTELQKACLTLFAREYFEDFDAMVADVSPYGYPEFQINEAVNEGAYIQFFEQAFEWDQMTYLFYPYFWSRKEDWVNRVNLESTSDDTFDQFLKAGSARVVVPVRPGYEDAVMYYLESDGEIWNGGEAPVIGDDLYVSIAEELAEDDLGEAVGDSWEVKIPTTLTLVKEDSTLPDWSDTNEETGS